MRHLYFQTKRLFLNDTLTFPSNDSTVPILKKGCMSGSGCNNGQFSCLLIFVSH